MALQVNITYEHIFDVLIREKSRDDLQKIEPSFFTDVAFYIQSKSSSLSPMDRDKAFQQVQNIKRMLRELYERREKKILNLALIASRTSPGFIDGSNMLEVEVRLFEGLIQQLNLFRVNVLNNVLDSKEPFFEREKVADRKPDPAASDFKSAMDVLEERKDLKLVTFVKRVPSFVGKELEIYGPFEEGQKASIPSELADILIVKGSAVEAKD